MSAKIVQLTEAVVDRINSATLSQSVTAVRSYVPVIKLEEIDDLEVRVVTPITNYIARDLKPTYAQTPEINIWISQRGMSLAVGDAVMLLSEEIIKLFLTDPITSPRSQCIGVAHQPLFDAVQADSLQVFPSLVSITFRMMV